MKILITGATGKIGQEIANNLEKSGIKVIRHSKSNIDADWVADLTNDNCLEAPKCDYCIHAAGLTPNSSKNLNDYLESNVVGSYNLINKLNKSGCKGIIYLSTISVYGDVKEEVIKENSIISSASHYGISKYLGEQIILKSEIKAIILRLPAVIGKYHGNTWVEKMINLAKNNENIHYSNPNANFNNIISTNSISLFCEKLIKKFPKKNKIFLLSANDKIRIIDLLLWIIHYTKSKSKLVQETGKNAYTIDSSYAKKNGYISESIIDILNIKMQISNRKP
jgi:nucleoside-diphosphate-sugar epimerase